MTFNYTFCGQIDGGVSDFNCSASIANISVDKNIHLSVWIYGTLLYDFDINEDVDIGDIIDRESLAGITIFRLWALANGDHPFFQLLSPHWPELLKVFNQKLIWWGNFFVGIRDVGLDMHIMLGLAMYILAQIRRELC